MITKFKIFENLSQDIKLPNGVSLSVDQKWRLSNMIKSYLVCVYDYLNYSDQLIGSDGYLIPKSDLIGSNVNKWWI